jgi:hypothetical protein
MGPSIMTVDMMMIMLINARVLALASCEEEEDQYSVSSIFS